MKCTVEWCTEPTVEPSTWCRCHVPSDAPTGPTLEIFSGNLQEGRLPRTFGKFFFLDDDKDGGQVREVPESFYAPEISVKSQ